MKKFLTKKNIIIFSVVIVIFSILAGYQVYKLIFIMRNDDAVIYKHPSSRFLFTVRDVPGANELKIEICYYHGRGIFLLDDPFYESTDTKAIPWKSAIEIVSVPEEYDITPNNCLRTELGGLIGESILPDEKEEYDFAKSSADFFVCDSRCYPQLYFMNDGRKFIVYKKFNYLFIREVNPD